MEVISWMLLIQNRHEAPMKGQYKAGKRDNNAKASGTCHWLSCPSYDTSLNRINLRCVSYRQGKQHQDQAARQRRYPKVLRLGRQSRHDQEG